MGWGGVGQAHENRRLRLFMQVAGLFQGIFFRILRNKYKKSRIRETKNLSTDADSRTHTIFKRLHDLSINIFFLNGRLTQPRVHAAAPRVGDGRSALTPHF